MRRRAAAITTIICAIALVIGLVASGWTPQNAKNSVIPSKEDIAWHDYTEPGVVANGNRMPDGTVINPWEATKGLEGNERFDAIMSELRARVNPDDKLKRPSAALLAEFAFDAQKRLGFNNLGKHKDEKDPNVVQEYLMHDPAYAREVYAKLDTIWRGASDGELLNDHPYTSAFYMEHDAIKIDGKPAPKVVAAESRLTGGHFIRLKVRDSNGKNVDLVYRLECGFQPVNITVPTNHEPVVDNPPSHEPEPEPSPEPSPEPEPEPGPELEPKNPDDGPTGRHQDNPDPDSGGGPNDEKETHHEETKEPDTDKSPSEYKAPDPPKADEGGNSGGGNSGGGNSGGSEKKARDDNGKQENYKDPDTGKESSGTVRTGDSKEYDHRDEKVDKNPSPVEKGVNPDPPKKESSGDSKKESSGGSNKESSGGSDKGSNNNDSGGSNDEKIEAPE
ncbi:hypothetical protein IJV57_04045 [Candidatus Saccharibacteria bacterium]|nr:hypothetical protein [Candidatus Saccharibacteria bacterium]